MNIHPHRQPAITAGARSARSFGVGALAFLFWSVIVVREGFAEVGDAWGISPSQATAIIGGVMVFFAVATSLVAIISPRRVYMVSLFRSVGPLKWIALFLLWSGTTLAWTQADSKIVALAYLCLLVLAVVTVIAQLKIFELEELLDYAVPGFVTGSLVLVLIAMATYNGTGRLGDPDLLHPNTLGKETAIGVLFALHRFRLTNDGRTKILWALAGAGLVLALAATVSKTSLGGFVIACLVYFLAGKHSLRAKVASVLLVMVLAGVAYAVLSPELQSYSRSQHGVALETLSGRLPLWQETFEMIQERPLLGYGFLSFRDYGPQLFNVRVVHAHNEWLHIWFSLGLVGIVLAAAIYASYFRSAWKLLRSSRAPRHAALALALLTLAFVRGITEADLTGLVFSLPLLLIMVAPVAVATQGRRTVALRVARPEWAQQAAQF